MRRLSRASVLVTAAALATTAVVSGSAQAGPANETIAFHALTGIVGHASLDCDGFTSTGLRMDLRPFDIRQTGVGSLHVLDHATSAGGPTWTGSRGIKLLSWPVFPVGQAGPPPTAQWVVTQGSHRLTSQPINLAPDQWNDVELAGVTLHEPGFTGSIGHFISLHGEHAYTVALFTGGCLDSPNVYVDDIRWGTHPVRHADFEPGSWLTQEIRPFSHITYGDTATDRGTLNHLETNGARSYLEGGHAELWRRYVGSGKWTKLGGDRFERSRVRLDVSPTRNAYFQWRFAGVSGLDGYDYPMKSDAQLYQVELAVKAHVAHRTIEPGLRVLVTGRVKPDTARMSLLISGPGGFDQVVHRQTKDDGTFRIPMVLPSRGTYHATLFATPHHRDKWASTTTRIGAITVD